MGALDWTVILLYGAAMVALAVRVGRFQTTREHYYLAGRSVPAWQISSSMLATQLSAVSLVGAPAFIAAKAGGGLVWLQYEIALPFAMGIILALILPAYFAARPTTIYEYLEHRFGGATRTALSSIFMLTRGAATGVILWATALIVAIPLGWNPYAMVVLIGALALAYTWIGGIKADILTDVVQLGVLAVGTLACILSVDSFSLSGVDPARLAVVDPFGTGLGDGASFSALPMFFGGLVLYVSYYACDQSQAQRLLAAADLPTAQRAVFWNGVLRFPLTLGYCLLGILLAGYLARHPSFAATLQDPNELVPRFLLAEVPSGVRGLIIAGVLAAAMSSLDSAFNSLSAATLEDVLRRYVPAFRRHSESEALRWSRILTAVWGVACIGLALVTPFLATTVIEAINKIGSVTYGPILGVFLLGIASRRAAQTSAIAGLLAGVAINAVVWAAFGDRVSWLWWNVIGLAATLLVGRALSRGVPRPSAAAPERDFERMFGGLILASIGILVACGLLEQLLLSE